MDVRYRDQYNVIILDRGTAHVDCLLWSVYDKASTKHYPPTLPRVLKTVGQATYYLIFLQLQQQFHYCTSRLQ
jgi:hypothetical protein